MDEANLSTYFQLSLIPLVYYTQLMPLISSIVPLMFGLYIHCLATCCVVKLKVTCPETLVITGPVLHDKFVYTT